MNARTEATRFAVLESQIKPQLDSYDSATEFSLSHWVEVTELVRGNERSSNQEGLPCMEDIEEALDAIASEVEPTAANQHFSGNVV